MQNETLRQVHQQQLKTAIRWELVKEKITQSEFTQALAKKGINVVLRRSNQGNIYGLTYIDFRTKCVFNGSDLGKEFSAKAITEKCCQQQQVLTNSQGRKSQLTDLKKGNEISINNSKESVLLDLLSPVKQNDYLPHQLVKKKKKKKSKGLRL